MTVSCVLFLYGPGLAAAGEWRFPVGLTYVSGVGDIVDQYEDNLQAEGYETEKTESVPVGLSFQPYYSFDSGLGIGVGFGPTMMIFGDVDFFNLPVNVCLRYTIAPKANTSAYLRAGASHNLASGDYVASSKVGFVGALGIEFLRHKRVGIGIEVGYDSSTIELDDLRAFYSNDTNTYTPTGFMVSVFAVF